ncbi:MAG: transglycosylase SLT domain-containing protein [Candidatus Methanofastidiosa archaeon]|nr:transglycosylase SLT domain-containing protein [Candidatus Methanofastidiosa archaeon]
MSPNKFLFPSILVICGAVIGLILLVSTPRITLASSSSGTPAQEVDASPAAELSRAYPESILQWEELIAESAERYQLDPNFIAAVILQESGGNAEAYSANGAVGLMQVMPSDGIAASFICDGYACFRSRPSMQELFDPAFNIDYGARMLSGLIDKYGSQQEALYHYGPIDVGYRYADAVLSIYTSHK